MRRKTIPPWIYCPRCGARVELIEDTAPETLEYMRSQGYTATARGVCECGLICVLCYQPLPASPTFSLFFDIYPSDVAKKILIGRMERHS